MIQIKDNMTLLFIGDSITDIKFNKRMSRQIKGANCYPKQVEKELKKQYRGLKFIYRGTASNRSYHVYDRLTNDCIWEQPDIVVMLIGVNDAWQEYKPEEYTVPRKDSYHLNRPFIPHMKEIYRRLEAELPDTKLIVMLPFLIDTIPEKKPFHIILDQYREQIKELAAPTADAIIDLQQVFDEASEKTPNASLALDGIHPTNLGHQQIAQALLKILGEKM